MATIANLVVQISADMSTLKASVEKSQTTLQHLETQSSKTAAVLGTLGKALAATFSVGMVMNFSRAILANADSLVKLSDKTGITIEGIQKLKYAAGQTGVQLESVTQAVNMMQRRLAGGDASAEGALKRLGIAVANFRTLAPEEQFTEIAKKIATVESPALRAKLAFDLMGKGAAESLPLLISNIEELMDAAPKMSTAAVKALDDLGDKLDWMKLKFMTFAGEAAAGLLLLPDLILAKGLEVGAALERMFADVADSMAGLPVVGEAMTKTAEGHRIAAGLYDWMAGRANANILARAAAGGAQGGVGILGDTIEKTKKALDLLKTSHRNFNADLYQTVEDVDDATGAIQHWRESLGFLNEDGLIPAWDTFTDMLDVMPDYTAALDAAHEKTQALRESTEGATETTSDWTSSLRVLSSSFRLLAQTSGTSGLGAVANVMANAAGAMQLGATAGANMKMSLDLIGGTSAQTKAGLVGIASATMQMAAAMDQATQSTSHWQNAISGAATGAAAGAQMSGGNPYATAIGGIVGAIYGYTKKTPGDDVTAKMKRDLEAQYGGYRELERQARLAGVSLSELQRIQSMGLDDMEAYTAAVKNLANSIEIYQQQLNMLKKAGEATATIADALGVATTQTQFERLGLYVSAIFGKMLRETGSLVEAFAAVGDALDKMIAAQDTYWFKGTKVLDQILPLRRIMNENTDLMTRVSGLGAFGAALGPQYLRSMNLLPTFGADLAETFAQLKDRAGVGEMQALMLMQAPLQQLWEASTSGGRNAMKGLDQNTQLLIQKALDAGLVGFDMRAIGERQLDVLSDIRDILAGPHMPGTGPGAGDDYGRIDIPEWDDGAYYGRRRYANGTEGFVNFGAGTPALLHGWEAVVPYSRAGQFVRDVGGRGTSGDGDLTITVPVYLDGKQVAQSTVRHLPSAVNRYGVH